MKKLTLLTLLIASMTLGAAEDEGAPLHQGPQIMPKIKAWMRDYGVSEDLIDQMSQDVMTGSSIRFHKDDLKALSEFSEQLCQAFKGADVTFYLGLNEKGELGIAMYPMHYGVEIKMDC